jgi:adenylate kinase family enzyme
MIAPSLLRRFEPAPILPEGWRRVNRCYDPCFMACRHRRIVVIGATGSGKSTFAQRLARSLDVTFVELDALFWEADWTSAPPDVFRARTDETTRGTAWVVAGNYRHVRDIVWPRAEAIVWLDYPLPLVFWRLTVRTVRRALTREVLWSGNRENLGEHLMLWSERSLLKTYWRYKREYPSLFALPEHAHIEIIHLRAPREAERWLQSTLG